MMVGNVYTKFYIVLTLTVEVATLSVKNENNGWQIEYIHQVL